jgi:hypothetical protein
VHDITDLEKRGIPGVVVATEQFISAAEMQSEALRSSPACVFTEHPIQDRTDEEMVEIAEKSFEQLVSALTP